MSFLHLEHHGYFYGVVASNNKIEYQLGHKLSSQNIWELGPVVRDYNTSTRIRLSQPIHLNNFMPREEEDLEAVNNLTQLGPLREWMRLNPELVDSIKPNILSNRGILKKLCLRLRTPRDCSFLVKLDDLGRYVFHSEPYEDLYEEDLTGFAFENFISYGSSAGDTYDYREKHYSVQSLTIKDWKILYNAEYDGFMKLPLWPLKPGIGGSGSDYNVVKAAPVEMKLWKADNGGSTIPDWKIQTWFAQCQLGNIDDLIIGINPNGRKSDPLLDEICLHKTQDLPSLCKNKRDEWSPSKMMRNLEEILQFLDNNIKPYCTNGETFKIRWIKGQLQPSEVYRGSTIE